MRKRWLLPRSLSPLILLACAGISHAGEAEIKQAPKPQGEKIVYSVKMGKLPIGEAIFTEMGQKSLNGSPVNVATFETRAPGFHDLEIIYSDQKTLLPVRVERDVRQIKQELITEEYDQKNFSLTITKYKNKQQEIMTITKKSPIHNAVILPFYLRHIPVLKKGWNFTAILPTQEYLINYEGTQRLATAAGTFECDYFTSTPRRFKFWITKDDRRIPAKITATSGLNYTMVMKEYFPEVK